MITDNLIRKIRLMMLIGYLEKNTDENHLVSTRDIMKYYAENGASSDRKTLDDDIKLLQEFGYKVVKIKSSPNKYYLDKLFDEDELRMIIRAVQTYKKLSPEQAISISERLPSLSTEEIEESLQQEVERGRRRLVKKIEKQKEEAGPDDIAEE